MEEQTANLTFGAIEGSCVHLCVDMQNLFAGPTQWHTPWMLRVLPRVLDLVAAAPARTIFTRFIPAAHPGLGRGTWKRYYERWADMTLEKVGQDAVDLVPDLRSFVPPARVIDKHVYSPWLEPELDRMLNAEGVGTLIVSGGETDVCVLGTVLGAVDRGYRVIVATDALCSSSDESHDASLRVYSNRYGQQVEAVTTATILQAWRR
jgi:nicotinamidase-related amidase